MLTLSLKQSSRIPLEVETLLPEWLVDKSIAEIERLPVAHGNRSEPLAQWFNVSGNASDSAIAFQGDCGNVKRIGEGMKSGQIFVEGNAGLHAGAMMSGGQLHIHGHAGDWLGAEMTGGKIEVRGSADHQVGAAYRGSRKGMTGGRIIIHGNAGDELGLLMRRGLILVGGMASNYCGASMIAGTIVVSGGVGHRMGAGMKRGTIIVRGVEPEWHPGTAFACTYQPAYFQLFERSIREAGLAEWFPNPPETIRCHRADLITGGRGEIWHLPVE
jgi:formylmethanofuran dehydrogenase subunit C